MAVIEENKNDNKIINKHINKLDMIENKFIEKNLLLCSIIKLKEHFTKLTI